MCEGSQRSEWAYLQQVVQLVLPGLSEELLLDADEGGFPEILQTHHHPWTTIRTSPVRGHNQRREQNRTQYKTQQNWVIPLGRQQSTRMRGGIRWSPHSSPDDGLGTIAATNHKLPHLTALHWATWTGSQSAKDQSKQLKTLMLSVDWPRLEQTSWPRCEHIDWSDLIPSVVTAESDSSSETQSWYGPLPLADEAALCPHCDESFWIKINSWMMI